MESCSPTSTLLCLDRDCLEFVLEYASAYCIGRLWLSGNSRIRQLLASGVVKNFAYHLPSKFFTKLKPTLLYEIPITNLELSLSVKRTAIYPPLCLEGLSPTLKSLKLPDCMPLDPEHFTPESPLALKIKFFELHTLHAGPLQGSPQCWEFSLPPTLTTLILRSSPNAITDTLIASLPLLTHLDGSCHDSIMMESAHLPPYLRTLRLADCPVTRFVSPIKQLTLLTALSLARQEAPSPGWKPGALFSALPPSLTSFSYEDGETTAEDIVGARFPPLLSDLNISSVCSLADTTKTQLFSSLPSLLRLTIGQMDGIFFPQLTPQETAALPRTLTELHGPRLAPQSSTGDFPPSLRLWSQYVRCDEEFQTLPTSNLERIQGQLTFLTSKSLPHLLSMTRLRYLYLVNTDLFELESVTALAAEVADFKISSPFAGSSSSSSSTTTSPVDLSQTQLSTANKGVHTPAFPFQMAQQMVPSITSSNDSLSIFKRIQSASRSSESTPHTVGITSTATITRRPLRGPRTQPSPVTVAPFKTRYSSASANSSTNASKTQSSTNSTPTPNPHLRMAKTATLYCCLPQHIEEVHLLHSPADRNLVLDFDQHSNSRQHPRTMTTLEVQNDWDDAYEKLPTLLIRTDFPKYLVSLKVHGFEVNPILFLKLIHCKYLERISVTWVRQLPLKDEHVASLPRGLTSLRVLGAIQLTVAGFRALPSLLSTLILSASVQADKEMNELTGEELASFWPRRCSKPEFMLADEGHTFQPLWLFKLKKHLKQSLTMVNMDE